MQVLPGVVMLVVVNRAVRMGMQMGSAPCFSRGLPPVPTLYRFPVPTNLRYLL